MYNQVVIEEAIQYLSISLQCERVFILVTHLPFLPKLDIWFIYFKKNLLQKVTIRHYDISMHTMISIILRVIWHFRGKMSLFNRLWQLQCIQLLHTNNAIWLNNMITVQLVRYFNITITIIIVLLFNKDNYWVQMIKIV